MAGAVISPSKRICLVIIWWFRTGCFSVKSIGQQQMILRWRFLGERWSRGARARALLAV
jgi:hypothetical protein